MEVVWSQWQLTGYASDSQRILRHLQNDDRNTHLAARALELLYSYFVTPSDVSTCTQANENIVKLAQILYVYVHAHGFWQDICTLWPKLISVAQALPEPTIYVQLTKQLAVVKTDQGNVSEAQVLYDELICMPNFEKLPPEQQADVYHQASVCHLQQGNYCRAKDLLLSCLAVSELPEHYARTLEHVLDEKWPTGLRIDVAAPPLWESKAYAFNQLGNLALKQGNFKAGQRYYEQCLEVLLAHGQADNLACVAYQSLGQLFVSQHRFADATPLLEKNLAIRQRRQEIDGSTYASLCLATNYLGQHRLREAESLLNQTMITFTKLQNRRSLALCHLYFGYLEQKRGCHQNALAQWHEAQTLAREISAKDIELQALTATLKELLVKCHLHELGNVLIDLRTNLQQQAFGPLAAGRLLLHYLAW